IYKKTPVTPAGIETLVVDAPGIDDWQPAVSPDGQRLCFTRGPQSDGADLYTVPVTGGTATPFSVTSLVGDLNCVWSPDGTRVLFTLGAFGAGELNTRDANATAPRPLPARTVASPSAATAAGATNSPRRCANSTVHTG